MINIKSCKIIYGYVDNCLDDCQDSPVLLIEPRSNYIDKIRKLDLHNVTLISKVLVEKNINKETLMYYDKESERYWLKDVDNIKKCNVKIYNVYCTTIENIIMQYKIQNVKTFILNINIGNFNEILESITPYNHIFSKIIINKSACYFNRSNKILNNFYLENDFVFSHKNLNVDLPKIGMYFLNEYDNKDMHELEFLMRQYKMNIIINKNENEKDKIIIPYPESVKILSQQTTTQQNKKCISKIYYENVIQNLESIFCKQTIDDDSELKVNDLEIIIQFNQKYFGSKKTLQIMYPLKDNTIYVNKVYDIMYATKNCMYMLYQILKSTYFSDYITLKNGKPTLLKIFAKRYFYDYISKIFVINEF
jgi:hypothetical protein